MHKKFEHEIIEKKWQKVWSERGTYDVKTRDESKEKEYVLVEWPYPSGNLHIGHWFAFAVVDIYVRTRRMQGKQVIFPIGFDAFGLPAENAAIKNKLDPKAWTESNIAFMKTQLESMGNAFSWNMSTSSTDPEYYKWTQWMFTEFYKNNIAYRGKGIVNWCPGCNTVIANEQVLPSGACERSGDQIEKREMKQWMLRITDYADRLIDDLDSLDWPEHIKETQRRWIGRSKGAEIPFALSTGEVLNVFTTRPDTLFGATYLVLAPEHDLILKSKAFIANWNEVESYIKEASQKDEILRTKAEKEKTGVLLEGITAKNPATGDDIPVYIADYVLKGYGTGAIMSVPAHDDRDFAFATKYSLPIKQVVKPVYVDNINPPRATVENSKRKGVIILVKHWCEEKYLLNTSEKFNWKVLFTGGIEEGETALDAARREILEETGYKNIKECRVLDFVHIDEFFAQHKNINRVVDQENVFVQLADGETGEVSLEEKNQHQVSWHTREEMIKAITHDNHRFVFRYAIQGGLPNDWDGVLMNSGEFDGMNSEETKEAITKKVGGKLTNTYRLRDWSIGRQRYWGVPIPIVYDPEGKPHAIPKEHLPWHLPTDVDFTPTGEAPLAKSKELKERTERIFGVGWTPEVETMDTFVDSSWYFLRYLDNDNETEFSSEKRQEDWMPIDIYFGGAEHTTMHLLYSRFWQKALFDLGLTTFSEPYKKRINRGLVLGPDGNKMSKSKGNVIDPDIQVRSLGADTVKMYLAFMGPYGETTNYPWDMGGIAGIRRFLERVYGLREHIIDSDSLETEQLLAKTIAKVTSDIGAYKFNTAISALMVLINHVEKNGLSKASYEVFLRLLAPFAPHLTEELWSLLHNDSSIHELPWPVANAALLHDVFVELSVQINGKMRGTVSVSPDADESTVLEIVKNNQILKSKILGEIDKVIYVPKRIINIVLQTPP